MSEHVRVTTQNGVMKVTLARPEKKNALTNAMYGALTGALLQAEQDAAVRAVLFQGEGGSFTAGNDITDFAKVALGETRAGELRAHSFITSLAKAGKPLVAAVQGRAVGIGLTWLLHCDLVYVANDALLSAPFVDLGLVPEAASSQLLQARIGYARAYALVCLGQTLDGVTAAALGLANAAFPAAEVQAQALAAAEALAKKPLGALIATKQLMRDAAGLTAVIQREASVFNERLKSAEAGEAFRAFMERRPPDFSKL